MNQFQFELVVHKILSSLFEIKFSKMISCLYQFALKVVYMYEYENINPTHFAKNIFSFRLNVVNVYLLIVKE